MTAQLAVDLALLACALEALLLRRHPALLRTLAAGAALLLAVRLALADVALPLLLAVLALAGLLHAFDLYARLGRAPLSPTPNPRRSP